MRYLIPLLLVLGVLWLIRLSARKKLSQRDAVSQLKQHEEMVVCAQCGVHLPRSESLRGPEGVFCSEAHRIAFVRRDTDS